MQRIVKHHRLTRKELLVFDQEAKSEYESGKTIRAIASESGRSYGTVHRALRRARVQFRARGGSSRLSPGELEHERGSH
jgi:IS30 family transposase